MAKEQPRPRWHICDNCDRRAYEIEAPVCDCQPDRPQRMRTVLPAAANPEAARSTKAPPSIA